MQSEEVVPSYEELLKGSAVTFVQDQVTQIDLKARRVILASGLHYDYRHLVLGLGSTQGYFGTEGASQYAFALRTQADAETLKYHLRDCLQRASQCEDAAQRKALLTFAVVGAGPSGVETAATLADLLPSWYAKLNGNLEEIRIVLVNHGSKILSGDVNAHLQQTATDALNNRTVPVEMLLGVGVKSVSAEGLSYLAKTPNQTEKEQTEKEQTEQSYTVLPAATVIWTAGTATHPLIATLPLDEGDRDKHQRPFVTPTLQLLSYPEVFAAGDCAVVKDSPQPPVAQIAYQQGAGIARNLIAIAKGKSPQSVQAGMRGTLLKLGIHNGVANLFDKIQIAGEAGDAIRNATYLEMLPTPLHNFKATAEWLTDDIFERHQLAKSNRSGDSLSNSSQRFSKNRIGLWVGGAVLLAAVVIGLFVGLKPQRSLEPPTQNSPSL